VDNPHRGPRGVHHGRMRTPTELPHPLRSRPFSVGSGRASGVTDQRMRGRDLARPHRAVRVPPAVEDSLLDRCRAYATIMRPSQFFSHLTAARLWGLPLATWSPDEPLDVAEPAPRRAPRVAGVRGHQFEDARVRVLERFGMRVADPVSTWLHLARVVDHERLVAIGDHLVRTPRFPDPDGLRPFCAREQLAGRLVGYHGRGRRAAALAAERVRPGVDSPQETRLRLLLADGGLPEPLTDVEVRDARGRVVTWLDMYYPGLRLAVEYDGQQHRTSDRQFARDGQRIEELRQLDIGLVRVERTALGGGGSVALRAVTSRMREHGWPDRSAL
jgi:hypothetical protein